MMKSSHQLSRQTICVRFPRWASAVITVSISVLLVACGVTGSSVVHTCGEKLGNGPASVGPGGSYPVSCDGERCYGIAEWKGSYTALASTISIAKLTCNICVKQFANNEIWLSDNSANWVEAGYGTFDSGAMYSFWADNRATSVGDYTEHFLDTASPGAQVTYSIGYSGSDNSYNQTHQGANTSIFPVTIGSATCYNQQSTANALDTTTNYADIGLELYDGLTTGTTPTCANSVPGPTAKSADFTATTLNGGAASGGTVYAAGSPLVASWGSTNTTVFTTACP